MVTETDWTTAVSRLVKVELARAGLTLSQLAQRLCSIGVQETEASIKGKLHRGTFSATFLVQCMTVLQRDHIELGSFAPSSEHQTTPERD